MIETQVNIFDAIVIGVLGLSALLAFFRGFLKEVLSLGAWVGAGLITLYAFPEVAEQIEPQIGSEAASKAIAVVGTFIISLIVISIFNAIIMRYAKPSNEVGVFDNLLGLLFGAGRGIFIVSLTYLMLSFIMSEQTYPEWVKEAKSRPYVERSAKLLAEIAPGYLQSVSSLKDTASTLEAATALQGLNDSGFSSIGELPNSKVIQNIQSGDFNQNFGNTEELDLKELEDLLDQVQKDRNKLQQLQ